MLSLYEFNQLSNHNKGEEVWKGTFLADRKEESFTVQLYKLNNFYVELFYDPVVNKVICFAAFNTNAGLAPYLKTHAFKF